MTRVDFYILSEHSRRSMKQILCSVTAKAYGHGHKIYVHTENNDQASQIDDLLWTCQDISFLPHGQAGIADQEKTPILIGHTDPPVELHDIIINMTNTVPLFFGRFDRLIEIVSPSPDQRDKARERYRFYQERGYTLNTHELDV